MAVSKDQRRKKIHLRLRKRISGTAERPRLSVYRSNKAIYCQAIDDQLGVTLAAASSLDAPASNEKNRIDQSKAVGKLIAEKLQAKNINQAYFDRSGYIYHGRIKAVAEGARETGLKI